MPNEEEYELMPHQTIVKMKHELELLKKRAASTKKISSKEFMDSVDSLSKKIDSLMSLFQEAAEEMKVEEEEPGIKEQIHPLVARIDEIEEENRKIAQGILVVADMVEELKAGEKKIEGKISRPMPPPRMPPPPPRPMPHPMMAPRPEERPLMGMERAPSAHVPPLRMVPERPIPPRPMGAPMRMERAPSAQVPPGPPPRGPTPLPPLPEVRAGPKKEGFLSKLFKKK